MKLKHFLILVKKIISLKICFAQNLIRIYITLYSPFLAFHFSKFRLCFRLYFSLNYCWLWICSCLFGYFKHGIWAHAFSLNLISKLNRMVLKRSSFIGCNQLKSLHKANENKTTKWSQNRVQKGISFLLNLLIIFPVLETHWGLETANVILRIFLFRILRRVLVGAVSVKLSKIYLFLKKNRWPCGRFYLVRKIQTIGLKHVINTLLGGGFF